MNTNSLRLETKSEGDETKAIETALANMTAAFEANKKTANDNEAALKKRIDDLELKLNRPGSHANDNKEPTAETKAFEKFIRRGPEALGEEAKSLRVSDNTAGGYLAPDQFNTELDRNVVLYSPVRQVARVLPTGSPAVIWPKRTGGMTAAWVGETGARPETTVTFGQNRYTVCELAAYVDVANSTLEDSAFDINSLLSFEFGEEFGYEEGKAFVGGASQLSPTGFLSDTTIAYTPSGGASNVTSPDPLIDLFHAVKVPYRANGVWMMNSTTLSTVRKFKDGQGRYLVNIAGLDNTPVTTILGRPVIEAPDMPDIGANTTPIVFGDFSQGYRIFDRISLSVLRDPYSQATNGMTRFHGRRRVAGGVGKAEALRKLKISTT
ncbi:MULTISPECIES: phage major capsid protein [unclassified Bradyrhizobium]|uniref:phage major capsid protein n=1 Tax=unclassified Bradyrhizobium TaxID=2631580 RepID=UPI001BAACC23|nr:MULTISPECIES: phage major capsid protein [unclassified Bradyrhizobium]MBR1204483.1 phage major capsid protein [Bradyrhizobium sp. AUGA SZCCT0124]MBR1309631.1 phage major capsid protein [Bradyrhizobium sp. AUGA SZCCT0051]MBR1339772.1 phage major capsid protein [Bradyrhizobium sp. AUGA SZCCT0105]MBR1354379.1 phage major capsid protein [Bradyrhizobium sp. AUGA SZCCT0045]